MSRQGGDAASKFATRVSFFKTVFQLTEQSHIIDHGDIIVRSNYPRADVKLLLEFGIAVSKVVRPSITQIISQSIKQGEHPIRPRSSLMWMDYN